MREIKLVLRMTNNLALLKKVVCTLSINRKAFQIVYFLMTTIKLSFFSSDTIKFCNLYNHRTLSLFFKIYIQKQVNQTSGTITCKEALPLLYAIAVVFLSSAKSKLQNLSLLSWIFEKFGVYRKQ